MWRESQTILLPSWIGLAETTLLLAPSPIIVWATIQNSYNSPNSRPKHIRQQPGPLSTSTSTFERELPLSPGHGQGGDAPLELLVESVAQHLAPPDVRLGPGQDDGVPRHGGRLDVRGGIGDWKYEYNSPYSEWLGMLSLYQMRRYHQISSIR